MTQLHRKPQVGILQAVTSVSIWVLSSPHSEQSAGYYQLLFATGIAAWQFNCDSPCISPVVTNSGEWSVTSRQLRVAHGEHELPVRADPPSTLFNGCVMLPELVPSFARLDKLQSDDALSAVAPH